MVVFGEDTDYDQKVINMMRSNTSDEEFYKKVEDRIKEDTDLLEKNKDVMDQYCVAGYKWSEEMKSVIQYYKDLLLYVRK